jgi:CheY-like chemotaxis protein
MRHSDPYIFIAEDDPDDQEMLVDRFRRRNPKVGIKWLQNGSDAATYLRGCSPADLPHLILVDYKMPGLTGAEVLKSIQHDDRYKGIPKVVWSTSNNQEYIDNCLQHGADKYFTKPSDMPGFDRMVDYLICLFETKSPKQ